jgi:phage shock protein C
MSPPQHTRFYLDLEDKQWRGVCAGIADYIGVDVTIVRATAVVMTLMGGFPWTIIAYFVVAHIAKPKPRELRGESPEKAQFWQGLRASPRRTLREVKSRFRDIDRRLAQMETYMTSSNTRLAREIDELR